ncbi:MAG: hypothetical protein FWH28_08130 [Clostridiales bacterium]|nr:hypothetical protein [Clostridiales bacterium]
MLTKLMKYEFKATGHTFLPLLAALILLSIVNRLLNAIGQTTPMVISTAATMVLIACIIVLTLVMSIQRFRQNLLSNEGYLMMTLPVRTDNLILSKLFVSAIWILTNMLALVVAVIIMISSEYTLREVLRIIQTLGDLIAADPGYFIIFSAEVAALFILCLFSGILLLYLCLSLSMLVNKHRGLFAFAAFFVISSALQIAAAFANSIATALGLTSLIRNLRLELWNPYSLSQLFILISIAAQAFVCLLFYFSTRYMLKNKLNLQ